MIFSILILTGFWISVQSVTVRKVVTVVYLLTLFWYTFGCRMTTITGTPVYGSDPGPAVAEPTTWERFVQLIKTIFGSQPDGTLAGGGWFPALVFNALLFVPMGYLLRCKKPWKTILICSAVSITIEILQELTGFGMFDWNDWIANSIGATIGVVLIWMHRSSKAG